MIRSIDTPLAVPFKCTCSRAAEDILTYRIALLANSAVFQWRRAVRSCDASSIFILDCQCHGIGEGVEDVKSLSKISEV
jgi:hypothetical protein